MDNSLFRITVESSNNEAVELPVSFPSTISMEGDWVIELSDCSILSPEYRLPIPFIVSGKIRILPAKISPSYKYFKDNKENFLKEHYDEEVEIYNQEVIGFYKDKTAALEGLKRKGLKEEECCVITCNESEFKSNFRFIGKADESWENHQEGLSQERTNSNG